MQLSKNNISFLKPLLIAALSGVYISVSFFNTLHEYLHHELLHQEICTAEAEKNPCHKRIFHHNLAEGCKHQNHVFSLGKACKLCDALLDKYYFPSEKAVNQSQSKFIQKAVFFEQWLVVRCSLVSARLRAPPYPSFLLS